MKEKWTYKANGNGFDILDEKGLIVAKTGEMQTAMLIAAAPDLADVALLLDKGLTSWSDDETDSQTVGEWLDAVGCDEMTVRAALKSAGLERQPVKAVDEDEEDATRPAIWLQDDEDEAVMDCGCKLVASHGNSGPALFLCEKHTQAEN